MTSGDDPAAEVRRLREALGMDLRGLRKAFSRTVSSTAAPAGAVSDQIGRLLRGDRSWLAAAAAGVLAGAWMAVRQRLRRKEERTAS